MDQRVYLNRNVRFRSQSTLHNRTFLSNSPVAVTTVHLFVRIIHIDGMGIRFLGQNSEFTLLRSPEFYELVTKAAVFRQNGSIVALMFAVMAAKAAQSVHVSALAREILPTHLHDWVIVAII